MYINKLYIYIHIHMPNILGADRNFKNNAKNWDDLIQNWQPQICQSHSMRGCYLIKNHIRWWKLVYCPDESDIMQIHLIRIPNRSILCPYVWYMHKHFLRKMNKVLKNKAQYQLKETNIDYYVSSQWWPCSILNNNHQIMGICKIHPKRGTPQKILD